MMNGPIRRKLQMAHGQMQPGIIEQDGEFDLEPYAQAFSDIETDRDQGRAKLAAERLRLQQQRLRMRDEIMQLRQTGRDADVDQFRRQYDALMR